ncbi:MAG: CoA pyrophosphatase [Rhodospirillales bacterium]|nr:CoA pyrophosphatase [Rhodospirillales bacterium]
MLTQDQILERLKAFEPGAKPRSNEDAEASKLAEGDRNPWVRGDKPLKAAAVLVPLVARKGGVTVLLTKRSEHLKNHAGQISFPGGRVDDSDRDAEHTALRETEEEIGIAGSAIEVLAKMEDYVVGTGFLVSPIIGMIRPPFELDLHDHEVAEVIEVPLAFVLDPKNIERHSRDYEGTKRYFFAITWQDYYIWGATAGMLRNLSNILWIA